MVSWPSILSYTSKFKRICRRYENANEFFAEDRVLYVSKILTDFSCPFLVENVEHLLKLSDEYQVTELIFEPCVKFLEDQTKTRENVMKIVSLAKLFNLEKVRQGCIELLKNMKFEILSETVHLQDLDKEEMQYYLTQRIERLEPLESFLDELYPQFMGLLASLIWLLYEANKKASWCNKHVFWGQLSSDATNLEISECSGCNEMLRSMVSLTTTYDPMGTGRVPKHGRKSHFDSNLFSVMEKFSKLKQS